VSGVVAPVTRDVVAPLVDGVLPPLAGGVVAPVVDGAVTPLAHAVVAPLVDDVVTPVVGDGLVAPLAAAVNRRVMPLLRGVTGSAGGEVGPGLVAILGTDGTGAPVAVGGPGAGPGVGRRVTRATNGLPSASMTVFPSRTGSQSPEPVPVSAVPAGGAGPCPGPGSSGSSGLSAVLAGEAPSVGLAPGGVLREREVRPASLAHAPVCLPG
jgi:hypothetical protein